MHIVANQMLNFEQKERSVNILKSNSEKIDFILFSFSSVCNFLCTWFRRFLHFLCFIEVNNMISHFISSVAAHQRRSPAMLWQVSYLRQVIFVSNFNHRLLHKWTIFILLLLFRCKIPQDASYFNKCAKLRWADIAHEPCQQPCWKNTQGTGLLWPCLCLQVNIW